MELKITSHNFSLDARMEELVSRKIRQALRRLPPTAEARVDVTSDSARPSHARFLVKLSVQIKGRVIRAECRGASALAAVHGAVGRLDNLTDRFKGQVYRSQRSRDQVSIAQTQADEALELDRELALSLPEEELAAIS